MRAWRSGLKQNPQHPPQGLRGTPQKLIAAGERGQIAAGRRAVQIELAQAANGHVDCLRLCIERGGKLAIRDRNRWTPLMCAAAGDHIECAVALVDAGAQLNLRSREGKTALGIAESTGRSRDVAEFLRIRGARR